MAVNKAKRIMLYKQSGKPRFPKTGEWFIGYNGNPVQAHKDLELEYQILQPVSEFYLTFGS